MQQHSSHLTETMTKHSLLASSSVGNVGAREKRFADVLGRQVAYIEHGADYSVVFTHGNPIRSQAIKSRPIDQAGTSVWSLTRAKREFEQVCGSKKIQTVVLVSSHTTFSEQPYIRWCCIDLSRPPALPDMSFCPNSTLPVTAFTRS